MADILIRGIEMPKEYGRCMVIFPDGRVTTEFGSQVIANAVSVPSHGRLIIEDGETDCNLNSLLSKLTAIERFLYNAEPRVEKDAQPDCMVDAVRIVADKVIEADARLEKIMACLGV